MGQGGVRLEIALRGSGGEAVAAVALVVVVEEDTSLPPPDTPAVRVVLETVGESTVALYLLLLPSAAAAASLSSEASDGVKAPPPCGGEQLQQQRRRLEALRAARDAALAENQALQCLARQQLDSRSKQPSTSLQEAGGQLPEGAEQRYRLALQQLQVLLSKKAAAGQEAARALEQPAAGAAAAEAHAAAADDAFGALLVRVASAAAQQRERGAHPAAPKGWWAAPTAARRYAAEHATRAEGVAQLRLQNAALARQAAAAERRLQAGSSLADGLHLIDFEQLRIERAALAGRLEARGGEVAKLQSRLAQTVQVAAHVREKLHAARQERQEWEHSARSAEGRLAAARERLAAAKAQRAALQSAREGLGQGWGVVTDPRCVEDARAAEVLLGQMSKRAAALEQQLLQQQQQAQEGPQQLILAHR